MKEEVDSFEANPDNHINKSAPNMDCIGGPLDVSFSMTVQNMLTLNTDNMTFTAMLEIDFKYSLSKFIELFEMNDVELDAGNFEFPYIICNMAESQIIRSNHFFRLADDEDVQPWQVSMYGSPKTTKRKLKPGQDDHVDLSKVIKCEKICMIGTFRYHSKYLHQPFDEIFAFFKIATDGRPGTESIKMFFHESDSSFVAFRKQIRDYVPIGDPIPLDIAMSHEYKNGGGPSYPRVYLVQRFRHQPFEDVVKFYTLPSLLPLLLFFTAKDGAGSYDSTVETIALSSGLILADVALLFVNKSPTMTFSEQSLLFNLAYLILGTVSCSAISMSQVESLSHVYNVCLYVFISLSVVLAGLMAIVHRAIATRSNDAIAKYLNERNFDLLNDLV